MKRKQCKKCKEYRKQISNYKKKNRETYIKKFTKKSKPIQKEVKKYWEFNGAPPSLKKKKKIKPIPRDRSTLIPDSCKLRIDSSRINKIHYELQTIDIEKFVNASAVLFRVFVELSLDKYLEKHKLLKGASTKKSGMNLQQKVFVTADHLEKKKWADQAICKGIKISVKDKNSILGIDTWQAYLHNRHFSPSYKELNRVWDNIQTFIERIWENSN